MQDRALASTRKSCRKPTMEKSLSISDPLLLNGLFLQQALSPGSGRKHLFMPCSCFTWLRDRFENSGWIITFWFLSLRKLTLIKGSNYFQILTPLFHCHRGISGILLRKIKENKFLVLNLIKEHCAVQWQENRSLVHSLPAVLLQTFNWWDYKSKRSTNAWLPGVTWRFGKAPRKLSLQW